MPRGLFSRGSRWSCFRSRGRGLLSLLGQDPPGMDLNRVFVGHFHGGAADRTLSEHGALQEFAKGRIEPTVAAARALRIPGLFQCRLRNLAEVDRLIVCRTDRDGHDM